MKYPGRQNMITKQSLMDIQTHFRRALAHHNAKHSDIQLINLEPTVSLEKQQGYTYTYNLVWSTEIGWKAYMYMTGIYV